jgi:hypothetical protein
MNATDESTAHGCAQSPRAPVGPDAAQQAMSLPAQAPDAPHGHVHRERDFGIGYGNSSGYGSALHFTDGHVDGLFRFR